PSAGYNLFTLPVLKNIVMDNQQQSNQEQTQSDKNVDVSRSQNRQAVAAASDSGVDREGSLSEDGSAHQAEGSEHTGSHREGQYNKQDTGKTMGEFMEDSGESK